MSRILPYEAIPFVEWSSDYQHHLADLLVQAYQEHGPIFRTKHLRYLPHNEIVFLVGPEANRFVLVDQRQKFSNLVGWSTIFPMVKVFGRGLLTISPRCRARLSGDREKGCEPLFRWSMQSPWGVACGSPHATPLRVCRRNFGDASP